MDSDILFYDEDESQETITDQALNETTLKQFENEYFNRPSLIDEMNESVSSSEQNPEQTNNINWDEIQDELDKEISVVKQSNNESDNVDTDQVTSKVTSKVTGKVTSRVTNKPAKSVSPPTNDEMTVPDINFDNINIEDIKQNEKIDDNTSVSSGSSVVSPVKSALKKRNIQVVTAPLSDRSNSSLIQKQVRINNIVESSKYESPKSSINESSVEKPNFDKINRINVAILSLRNQLRGTKNIEDLTRLASQIANLEHQAVIEKSQGYQVLEKKRKIVEDKVDKMRRQLKKEEDKLQNLDNTIYAKIAGYRKLLQMRINMLHDAFSA